MRATPAKAVARRAPRSGPENPAPLAGARRYTARTMAETKGFLGGSMKFNTGEEAGPKEKSEGPLLPLRVLVITDLVPSDEHNAGASAPEGPVVVDPKSFDELFAKLRLRLAIEVPSVLRGGGVERVELAPTGMKSFRPDDLCQNVPLLRSLLDGRVVLQRLAAGELTEPAAEAELSRLWKGSDFAREVLGLVGRAGQKPAPAPAPAEAPVDAKVGSILDMVDMGDAAPAAPPPPAPEEGAPVPITAMSSFSKISELISAVAKSARASTGLKPQEAIARIERAVSAELGGILQHPEVRKLEAAMRGLKLLADRAAGVPGVRLEVVSASARKAADALRGAAKKADPPLSLALVDASIDRSSASLSVLEALASAAEDHVVPVVVSTGEALFGVSSLGEIEKLDNKLRLFEDKASLAWAATAAKPSLRWATLVGNPVLGRAPYDKSTSRVREAPIVELPADEGGFVWTSPVYVVGALVLQSFKETGWPHRIIGARAGTLGDLPVREVKLGDQELAIATRDAITTDTQKEVGRMGVLLLAAAPNSDAVYLLGAPTAYVPPPKRTYDGASAQEVRFDRVSLVDQLFVGRVVQFLRALLGKIPAGSDPAEVAVITDAALGELFEDAAPASIERSVKGVADDGGGVAVTIRPRRFHGTTLEELSFVMPIG